jgi:osmotically-inducible protein OsmY
MTRIKSRYALDLALILSGALSGCANYPTCNAPKCQDDAAITAEVRKLLGEHPALNPTSLDVHTWNHVVYLYGLVDTEMERRDAESVALNAKGAVRVINLMGVNNGGW